MSVPPSPVPVAVSVPVPVSVPVRGSVPASAAAQDVLAERIAATVLAHPDVAGLHGGTYGAVATYLPGRRLIGVRLGDGSEPVELGVVVWLRRPIPAVVADLRATVSRMCGGVAVDITVSDVVGP